MHRQHFMFTTPTCLIAASHRVSRLFQEVVGPDGEPGYRQLVALAHALVELRHHAFVTVRQTREIIALWERLTERDKAAVTFTPRHQDRLVKGRFKTSTRHTHVPGVDSVKR